MNKELSVLRFWGRDPALKFYYSLDTLSDYSGNSNHLTTNNNTILTKDGAFFEPTSSAYLRRNSQAVNSFPFTWLFWVKSPLRLNSGYSSTVDVLNQGGNPGQNTISPWVSFRGLNQKLDFGVWGVDDRVLSLNSSTVDYEPNVWYCIVAVGRGTGNGSLYENGRDVTVPQSFSYEVPTFENNLYIGANVAYSSHVFKGWIKEVAIFNRALSPQEIYQYYLWATSPRIKKNYETNIMPSSSRRRLLIS